jgi:hypothetical protein
MRDDIHKNAPVPPKWKRVIQASTRDADWSAEGSRRLDDVMRAELVALAENNFVERLQDELNRQTGLLPGMRDLEQLRATCCARSAAQESVVGHAIRLARAIGPDHVDVAEAVRHGANEIADNFFRVTEEHCARNFPTQRRELMSRLKTCRSTLDVHEMARSTVGGSLSAKPSMRPMLNVDDSLPLGSQGRPRV